MSHTLSKRIRVLSITVFLLGIVTASLAYSINYVRRPKPVGFTMISTTTFTPSDGSPTRLAGTQVRFQKADGTWKESITYYNHDGTVYKEDTVFGQLGRGVFQVDEEGKALNFLSSMPASAAEIPRPDLRKDQRFVKEELVLGYKTYVLRQPDDDNSGYSASYYAPALANLPIKYITVSSAGTTVSEPVRIEIGEPSDEVFNSTPDLPVKYDHYRDKIQTMEERGHREAAEQMRRDLQKRLQQVPEQK